MYTFLRKHIDLIECINIVSYETGIQLRYYMSYFFYKLSNCLTIYYSLNDEYYYLIILFDISCLIFSRIMAMTLRTKLL